ncbi:lysylphosphatidylglycerol synthetase-like protein (DUF2156 family) [Kitasatospora sp. SolWspMP-SS2h]|uniref:bifunctional lysylphosphatidylglycerol flippase/synthetase MprF n=1 Tax=Kitasatospora sp. SolWspMP-SS2h TaxID=1305729 RepID=UPI000DBFE39C|nr:DUF2156 domain-containing protein [Kitasatospora sp. SolWspMP-SS2h]RAJ41685.1 lysylphosphatidylglycerol synthetase-like protein (DUF2156 family) [Kitasatospora sp. SolWspMP-SS2h]
MAGEERRATGPRVLGAVLRLPFTVGTALFVLALGLAVGGLWSPVQDASWYPDAAYGLPSFEAGRWWTVVTGALLGGRPGDYAAILFGFVLLVGFAESRMGWRWAAALTWGGQVFAVLLTALLLLVLRTTGWDWAVGLSHQLDTGFSAGMLLIGTMASATLRSPWRLRLRLGLMAYVLVSLLFVGQIADLEHTVAVAAGLLAGRWIRVPGRVPPSGRLSRREWRLLAVAWLVFIAAVPVMVWLVPGEGPLGSTYGLSMPVWELVIGLAVIAPLINGLRRGRRRAWWWTRLIASGYVVLGLLFAVLLVLVEILGDEQAEVSGAAVIPTALAWVAELVLLTRARDAFQVPSRPLRHRAAAAAEQRRSAQDQRDDAVSLLQRYGGGNLSWMTTWPDNSYFHASSGQCYVAYRPHAGVAVALGDPVGASDERARAVAEFAEFCDDSGLIPCFFSATEQVALAAQPLGWRGVQVAEDTVIDLEQLAFRGKPWQDVRTALNRAKKEGVAHRLVTLADEPRSVIWQVRALSEQWVGDMGLPEMGFTLGGVEEAMDPRVLVGLAEDGDGVLQGVTSWMPVYGGDSQVRGWTLDVMHRRQGGFRPVVEFLIASGCLAFQERGARFASLSGAPLVRGGPERRPTGLERVLDQLGAQLEPYYGFRSLHAFKAKFQPRYDPMYLVYRDEADLPRIGIALTRAYMPDAGPRDLLGALSHRHP